MRAVCILAFSACGGGSDNSNAPESPSGGAVGSGGGSVAGNAGALLDGGTAGKASVGVAGVTGSSVDNAGGAGAPDSSSGPRLVLAVEPPISAGAFRLSSSGFIVQQSSCSGSVCVRGFLGAR
ncbi:MAG TPA: hypothetical protein VNW92_12050 [Polyangiaceae bacterium]|nr:hypothetical protein [Polyangiaceae bacterium]